MSAKLDKIGADRDRALKKRDEWDAKYKELDRKYKAQENAEINDIVHAASLTPDQLAELIQSLSSNKKSDQESTGSMEEVQDETWN